MGSKYNKKYKKGKYNAPYFGKRNKFGYSKAQLADKSKWNSRILFPTQRGHRELWLTDTRKYDLYGIDTPPTKNQRVFNYKYRSKLRDGKKVGRENKRYRRYWYGNPNITKRRRK